MKSDPTVTTPRDQITFALRSFLEDSKPGVLALKGPWGVGKTYVWNSFLKEYEGAAKQSGYAYVSLFGISSVVELRKMIFAKHKPLALDTKRKWWRNAKKFSSQAIGLMDVGYLKNTEIFSEWIQNTILQDFIICIDDLERKEDSLTGSALLGFITSLREEHKCKVILIYNDAEVSEDLNKHFGEYREKVVDREVAYTPSVIDNYRLIFSKDNSEYCELASAPATTDAELLLGSDRRTLLQLFQCLNVTNIRVLQKTKLALDYFEPHLREKYPQLYPTFVRQVVKICCLYYIYGDRWSLKELLSTSPWTDLWGKKDNDAAKEKLREQRQPIRDISYSPSDADGCIVQYLERGYVDWNAFAPVLTEAEEKHGAAQINKMLMEQWSHFWRNFITPQETFVSMFRTFLIDNGKNLRLVDVDTAVSFLRELDQNIDLSLVLEAKIEEYAKQYAAVNPHLRDFRNLQAETVKRVNEKITDNLKPIPVEEAVNRLTKDGGWTPSDVKYLFKTTVDEFYNYFVSSEGAAPSTIKELRSRLSGDEEGKAVLRRIDEALRRIAKRSKFDAARVRQTDVTLP
jgi:hypothetical protein